MEFDLNAKVSHNPYAILELAHSQEAMIARRYLSAGLRWCRTTLRHDLQEGVTQNSLIVLAGHVIRLALGLVSSALLARGLGPAGLSVFSVVGAAMAIAITVADFGLSNSAIRQIAGDLAAMPDRARRTASAYARLKLLGGLLAIGFIVALAIPITHVLNLPVESEPVLIWIASLGLFATVLSGITATVLQALRRFRVLVITQGLNIGLTVMLMAGLFLTGRLTVISALIVGVVTTVAATSLGFFLLPSDWRSAILARTGFRSPEGRRLLAFSRWLWISAILSILSAQLDLLLLNRWMTPQIVGFYALALNLALKPDLINQTLHVVLLPTVSTLSSQEAYANYIRRSMIRSLLFGLLLTLMLPVARPFILAVYGTDYAASVNVFYLLMIVVLFDMFTTPILLLAFPMNMPGLIAASDGVRVAALLSAAAFLIPSWGMYGAAMAKLAAKFAGTLVIGIGIVMNLHRNPTLPTDHATSQDKDSAPVPLSPDAT
jgi:O-antigen/teichoic acid export membrane protein